MNRFFQIFPRLLLAGWLFCGCSTPEPGPAPNPPPKSYPLWIGKPPGKPLRLPPEITKTRTNLNVPGRNLVCRTLSNVAEPAIKVFPPPADKNCGAAFIICPGGGYTELYHETEGEMLARRLNSFGATGVVLHYRTGTREDPLDAFRPLMDARRAIRLVRFHAAQWGVDPGRVGIIGFSAGGHLAGITAVLHDKDAYEPTDSIDALSARPDFAASIYGVFHKARSPFSALINLDAVGKNTPPMFLVHADDDPLAPSENSAELYLRLRQVGVPAELHIYSAGGHGIGAAPVPGAFSGWTDRLQEWLRDRGIIPAKGGN